MAPNGTLGYDVFISEPIPIAVDTPLPNGERRMFSPLSTTLIYGTNDAVLEPSSRPAICFGSVTLAPGFSVKMQ